eukprot:TRINITY_DN170_c0_g2_i4.p1 TRINITY_DN170_c0_g2~~TRINITY_DN170_c0_g2_i4.p1  ORF type:complete len:215 (+),score=19.38 TRINITY_DN170_c0_g2_i4:52-645(+)
MKENLSEREVLTLIVYTDKGLCGSTNNQITRTIEKEDVSNQKFVLWGEKGVAAFAKSKLATKVLFSAHPPTRFPLTYGDTAAVSQMVLKENFDLIRIVHNKMVNAMTSDMVEIWLPSFTKLNSQEAFDFLCSYDIEATATDEFLASLTEFYFNSALNYAYWQNQACLVEPLLLIYCRWLSSSSVEIPWKMPVRTQSS